MYNFERSDKLIKILKKLFKKDKRRYEATLNKINEVISSDDPNHYKNLKRPLQHLKRVHVDKSFVLVFSVDETKNTVIIEDYDHHDNIYKK